MSETSITTAEQSAAKADLLTKPTLTVSECAVLFEVTQATIYLALEQGQLPAFRIGKKYRIPTAQVRKLLGLDDPTL